MERISRTVVMVYSPSKGIRGPGQPVTRLTADPVTEPRFTDPKAGKEITRRYWIVAVDALE